MICRFSYIIVSCILDFHILLVIFSQFCILFPALVFRPDKRVLVWVNRKIIGITTAIGRLYNIVYIEIGTRFLYFFFISSSIHIITVIVFHYNIAFYVIAHFFPGGKFQFPYLHPNPSSNHSVIIIAYICSIYRCLDVCKRIQNL